MEAGPAVAPKDENGKFDPTKIADVSDFGDWEEQGARGNSHEKRDAVYMRSVPFLMSLIFHQATSFSDMQSFSG